MVGGRKFNISKKDILVIVIAPVLTILVTLLIAFVAMYFGIYESLYERSGIGFLINVIVSFCIYVEVRKWILKR